jgi:hypothetical protein
LLEELSREIRTFSFERKHLQSYGEAELHVLADVLRRPLDGTSDTLLRDIRGRVCKRIGWTTPVESQDTYLFLQNFYTAQRMYLEDLRLHGREKRDKHQT